METCSTLEQTKSCHAFIIILVAAGIILALVINLYSLLNSWSMFGYADWEFQPFLSREGVAELFHSVKKYLLWEMLVALVATACVIFFLVKLLQGTRKCFLAFFLLRIAFLKDLLLFLQGKTEF